MQETNTNETTTEIMNMNTNIPSENPESSPSEIPPLTIGNLLRIRREEKGLNLKSISHQTKIHLGLLEYLEKDQLEKLPSKTYVRGFVKSAAKILGINQEVALDALEATYNPQAYLKEKSNNSKQEEQAPLTPVTRPSKKAITLLTPLETVKSFTTSSTLFFAKMIAGILILGIIGFNIKNLIDRNTEERLKLPIVLSTIHQKVKPNPKLFESKTFSKLPELETTDKTPIQVNIIQEKKDVLMKSDLTIKDINLKNVSLADKQFSEDTSLPADQIEEIFPSRYKTNVAKGVENVFINAFLDDSWITYKVDDKPIKKYVLRKGRTVFLRGEKIRLFIGNTKSLKIFYNNKPISINAKNAIKNLVFPEEMKTKYMIPLFIFQKDGTVVTSDEYIKENQPQTIPSSSTNPI